MRMFNKKFLKSLEEIGYNQSEMIRIHKAFRSIVNCRESPKSIIKREVEENPAKQAKLRNLWDNCNPQVFVNADDPRQFFDQTMEKMIDFCSRSMSGLSRVGTVLEECLDGKGYMGVAIGSVNAGTRFAGIAVSERLYSDDIVLVKNNPEVAVSDLDLRVIVSLENERLIPQIAAALVAEESVGAKELLDSGIEIVVPRTQIEQTPFYTSMVNIESAFFQTVFCEDTKFKEKIKISIAENFEKAVRKANAKSASQFIANRVMNYYEDVYSGLEKKLVMMPADCKGYMKCLHLLTLYAKLRIFGIEEAAMDFKLNRKIEMLSEELSFLEDAPRLVGKLLFELSLKNKILTTSENIICEVVQLKKKLRPHNIKKEIDNAVSK